MLPSHLVLYVQIGFAALLLLFLILRPEIFRSFEGKLLGLAALFVVPSLALVGGVTDHVERSSTTSYCLSCHVMSDYGKSLRTAEAASLPASHFQNRLVPRERACVSCHSNYGMSGDLRAKVRASRYVFTTYFGTVPETIRLSSRYRNRDCLACHAGARSFERAEAHRGAGVSVAAMKAGRTSCLKSGCHDQGHHVREIADTSPAGTPPAADSSPAPGDSAPAAPPPGIAPPSPPRIGS